jgi:hypothetical protein
MVEAVRVVAAAAWLGAVDDDEEKEERGELKERRLV